MSDIFGVNELTAIWPIRLCPSEIHQSQESVIWVGICSWIRPPDGWRSLKLRAPNHHISNALFERKTHLTNPKNPTNCPRKLRCSCQKAAEKPGSKMLWWHIAEAFARWGSLTERFHQPWWVSLSSNGLHDQNMTNSTRSPRFFWWCMLLFVYFHKERDTFYIGKSYVSWVMSVMS